MFVDEDCASLRSPLSFLLPWEGRVGVQKLITMNWDERWNEGMSELFPALLMLGMKRRSLCFPVWAL